MMHRPSLILLIPLAHAFVAPRPLFNPVKEATSLHLLSPFGSLTLADDFDQVADQVTQVATQVDQAASAVVDSGGGGIMETIGNFAVFLVGGVFFLFGLTFVMASVIIPAAAKQLEDQCKDLDPDLWEEYQSKLEPGETIDMRPELMQELGNKVQALMVESFDEMGEIAKDQAEENEGFIEAMDAEIVSKEPTPKKDDAWND